MYNTPLLRRRFICIPAALLPPSPASNFLLYINLSTKKKNKKKNKEADKERRSAKRETLPIFASFPTPISTILTEAGNGRSSVKRAPVWRRQQNDYKSANWSKNPVHNSLFMCMFFLLHKHLGLLLYMIMLRQYLPGHLAIAVNVQSSIKCVYPIQIFIQI